jgi:hydroxymethylbilane synthase
MSSPDERRLRVGTRSSRLALWQTDHVVDRLRQAWPRLIIERVRISTLGDRETSRPLSRIGDKGLFTKELEDGLRGGAIDLAVHSLKDLPTEPPAGLRLGAVLAREDSRDALVSAPGITLLTLPAGSRIGTSSLRRQAQIAALRPDLQVVDLRGNVPTRVEKVRAGGLDAAVLALAGLRRLGLEHEVAEILDPVHLVSAPGQGAVAVQIRDDDREIADLLAPLNDETAALETTAERALLGYLEGGCQVPVGALARRRHDGTLNLIGLVASVDGRAVIRREVSGPVSSLEDARALGEALARELLESGGREILAVIRQAVLPSGVSHGEPT